MKQPVMTCEQPRYTTKEEIANSITHGVGTVLAITGLAILIGHASRRGDVWHIVSCSIFGATLILSYLTSTLYHSIPQVKPKRILRLLDHVAIYLLIAGTYTPFMLVSLRGPWGWSLLATVWTIAIIGIILKTTMAGKLRTLSIILYLVMGWMVIIASKPIIAAVGPGGLKLLLFGGLAYSAGVIFYLWRSLPYSHAIWHMFVLAGSCLHFFAILFYVIP